MDPLADETIGGLVIWIPGSMMCVIAILAVIHRWDKREHRGYEHRLAIRGATWSPSNSRALEWPETAEELRLKVATPNRVAGLALGATSVSIFVIVIAVAVWIHRVA